MDKNVLEQLLSSYNWWMGISTVAVAVGILGEYVAHFWFEKEARHDKPQMAISIMFGVLVLGGVAGEYVFGKRLSQVSERLQQIADSEVAQANKDAAEAQRNAETAKQQSADTAERAAKAEQHAAQENVRAAKALEAAETARKNAEGFRLQIAQANERAANAERETARLTQKVADRTLTDTQAASVAEKIVEFAGQRVQIMTYWDASEPVALANRVLSALNLAKWKYLPPPEHSILIGGITGIQVYIHPEADAGTRSAAASLIAALNEQGIAAVERFDTSYPRNQIMINVGAKP